MAHSDVEKQPLFSANKTTKSSTNHTYLRYSLAALAALLIVLRWCCIVGLEGSSPVIRPSFTNEDSQAKPSHSRHVPDAIISRSPVLETNEHDPTTATSSAAAPTRTVLKTFEVAQPVPMPDGPAESDGSTRHAKDYSPELCTVLLMRHDFAWSYGQPYIGKLARVSLNI